MYLVNELRIKGGVDMTIRELQKVLSMVNNQDKDVNADDINILMCMYSKAECIDLKVKELREEKISSQFIQKWESEKLATIAEIVNY